MPRDPFLTPTYSLRILGTVPCALPERLMEADSLLAAIQQQIDQGDEYLDEDEFRKAIACFQEAVSLIPEPRY